MESSFGAFLRQERETRELSLDEIVKKTKIQKKFLIALEEDRLSDMPSAAILRGFIRSYADAVGVDQKLVISKFEESQKKLHPEKAKPKPRPENTIKASHVIIPGAVIFIILAVAVTIYMTRNKPEPVTVPTPVPVIPKPVNPVATPNPVPTEKPEEPEAVQYVSPPFLVRVKAVEICWLIATIDEKTSREATLYPGNFFEVRADKKLSILLGNAGGVEMTVNQAPLKPVGPHWKTARIMIPDDLEKFLNEGYAYKPGEMPAEKKTEPEKPSAPEPKHGSTAAKPQETKTVAKPLGTVLEAQTGETVKKPKPAEKKEPAVQPVKPSPGGTAEAPLKPKPEAAEKKPAPVRPVKPAAGDTVHKKPKAQIIEEPTPLRPDERELD
jgi:cytoskeleton protein RodZ